MAETNGQLAIDAKLTFRDEATPQVERLGRETRRLGRELTDTDRSLQTTRRTMRELAMGTTIVGTGLLSLSEYLKHTGNASSEAASKIVGFTGSMLIAIGTAAHLVIGILELIKVLRALQIMTAITSVMSWLGVGAVAAGAGAAARSGGGALASMLPGVTLAAGATAGAAAAAGVAGNLPGPGYPGSGWEPNYPLGTGVHRNPNYAIGGTVPGPIGAPVAAIVHGGETINARGGDSGGVHFHIHGGMFTGNESQIREMFRQGARIYQEENRSRGLGLNATGLS